MIYADNAATTKLDPAALEAMKPYLLEEYANASQPYSFSRKPRKALEEARATIADCIHAKPDEIFFTSGGTESNNWVIKSSAFSDSSRRLTIVSAFEHHSLLHSCSAIEGMGYPVAYLKPSPDGQITTEALEKCLSRQTRLVSVMFA
ncbi:MAG: aminotransferase class V-fold PLP-dependent enzyme, partial [Oscillibacter sp.]|nr:aminotransferase class V-fold PLP-dependent enzyme [Oscillibacter sp.]